MTTSNFDQMFPLGDTNDAFAAYFAGQSYLAPLTGGERPGGQRVVRAGM